jgi:hypothetical protein
MSQYPPVPPVSAAVEFSLWIQHLSESPAANRHRIVDYGDRSGVAGDSL